MYYQCFCKSRGKILANEEKQIKIIKKKNLFVSPCYVRARPGENELKNGHNFGDRSENKSRHVVFEWYNHPRLKSLTHITYETIKIAIEFNVDSHRITLRQSRMNIDGLDHRFAMIFTPLMPEKNKYMQTDAI